MKYSSVAALTVCLGLAACNAPNSPQAAAGAEATAPAESVASKRALGQEDAEPMQFFRAFGTEPFWGVRVEGDQLTFTTPEDQVGQVMHGTRRALEDGVEISGEAAGKPFLLKVSGGLCNDGMSDNQYQLESSFKLGDVEYRGCGEVGK